MLLNYRESSYYVLLRERHEFHGYNRCKIGVKWELQVSITYLPVCLKFVRVAITDEALTAHV